MDYEKLAYYVSIIDCNDVYSPAVCCAGIQRYDAWSIIWAKIGIRAKFCSLPLIFGMAIRSMPVSADDRLFFHAGLNGIHSVIPTGSLPLERIDIAPVGIVTESGAAIRNARDPAVDEDVMLRLIIIDH